MPGEEPKPQKDTSTNKILLDIQTPSPKPQLANNEPIEDVATDNGTFTLVALPDTQFLSQTYPDTFNKMTRWIAENWEKEKFDFVVHLGDIVNEPAEEQQWKYAAHSMSLLGDHPYTVLPGNHDFITRASGNHDYTLFNNYFSSNLLDRFANKGTFPLGTMINNYVEVKGYLILSVGYFSGSDPRHSLKEWVKTTLSNNSKLPVIVVTHDFITVSGELSVPGQELWDVLKDYPNVFFVLSGHAWAENNVDKQEKLKELIGTSGNAVKAITSNYQEYMGRNSGFIRIYRITASVIEAKTFSPLYGYLLDNSSQFSLPR